MRHVVRRLTPQTNRKQFTSKIPSFTNYFRFSVSRDVRSGYAICYYIAAEDSPNTPLGYYTLSNDSVPSSLIPEFGKAVYDRIPVTLIGRLAVDKDHTGMYLGSQLAQHAITTALFQAHKVGSSAILVETYAPDVIPFWERFGFQVIEEESSTMILMMETVRKLKEIHNPYDTKEKISISIKSQ